MSLLSFGMLPSKMRRGESGFIWSKMVPWSQPRCDLPQPNESNSRLENSAEVHSEAVANAPFKYGNYKTTNSSVHPSW